MIRELSKLHIRRWVIGITFLPFLLFAFYSVGTMPAVSKDSFTTVICSGNSTITITVDENGEPVKEITQKLCDWSLQLHASTLPIEMSAIVDLNFIHVRLALFSDDVLFSDNRYGHFFARAPPHSI
jgi:hypothetical protein